MIVHIRRIAPVLAATAIVLAPAVVLASPDAHGGAEFSWFNWPGADNPNPNVGFGWVVLNFVGLMLILEKLLFKKLRTDHAARYESIKTELAKATEAHSKASALVSEYETRLAGLDDELAEIKRLTQERADADRKRIVQEAEAEAGKIKAFATAQAEREAEVRRREIEAEIVDKAVDKAEALLRQQLGDPDQRRLVDTYVDQIGSAPLGAQGRPS